MTLRNPRHHRKTVPVSVRLTHEEHEHLKAKAKIKGLSLGEYVRLKLFEADFEDGRSQLSGKTRLSPLERQKLLGQILVQVGKLDTANALNDISEAIRLGITEAAPELLITLRDTKFELHELRLLLLKALGLRPKDDADRGRS